MTAPRLDRRLIALLVLASGAMSGCSSTLTMPAEPTTQRGDPSAVGEAPQTRPPRAVPAPGAMPDSIGVRVVDTALSMVGSPYRYGGSTPTGFDCSGLVHYAYNAAGVAVPRTTTQLLRASIGIALREARDGDLLFFEIESKPDHVGIFIGDGRFVHAPSSGKHVGIGRLDDPYWRSTFVSARRLDR